MLRTTLWKILPLALALPVILLAFPFGPPPGVSGAPGEGTCTACHGGTENSGPGSVTITVPSSYSSGTTFPIVVTVSDPNQRRWGFELSVRTAANQQAGTLIPGTDGFTQPTNPSTLSGIQFITHTTQGTRLGTTGGASFNFQWQAPDVAVGSVTFYVAANAANGDNTPGGDRIYTSSATVPPQPISVPVPSVSEGGVVNNASFALHPASIAPNTIIAIFGSNLTKNNVIVDDTFLGTDGKVTTTLGGASVKINGIAAPMLRAFPGQLVVQMPVELTGVASAQVEVNVEGQSQSSTPRTFFVDAHSPGIFFVGTGQGAVLNGVELNQGIKSLAAPVGSFPNARPARPGETVVIFCTGLGRVNDPVPTGVLASGEHRTVETTTVTIDGLPGVVDFAGLAPGFAGLYQVNVRIPGGTRTGNDLPVVLTVGGKQSNTVTIAVSTAN
ncbi:MAG: hypothetical protein HY649_01645 [Acidobacteria bacterium]|nr:hypothetical protein [Acidobacteriota bacterium]